jgi:capsular polysaccharide transport system ATP-binding protein
MKSRLGFGLSLFFDFDYLLIDEALSVGDKNFQKKSRAALMNKIKSSHVILVSHSMPILADLCDVAIYLRDGSLTYFDDVEKAIESYQAH